MFRHFTAAAAATLVSSCGGTPKPSPEFPETNWNISDGYDQRYLLAPGDTIEINVLTAPELSRTVTVAPDGRVRIPYSGPIAATGRTVDELRIAFTKALSYELQDPDVEVIASGYASQRIFIGGEVAAPSMYDLPGQIGPLQAIVMAGGFTNEARKKEVLLLRRIAGGEIRTEVVDIQSGLFDPRLADWGPMQRYDVIYVPQSRIAEENLFVQQWVRNALPIEFQIFYDIRNGN